MAMVIWPLVGWLSGLYRSRRSRSVAAEVFDVIRTTMVAFLLLVTLTYFVREVRFSRLVLIIWALVVVFNVGVARAASALALRHFRRRGYNLRHVLVVGTGGLAARVVERIAAESWLGLKVVGLISAEPEGYEAAASPANDATGFHSGEALTQSGLPVLGSADELPELVAAHEVDQVIVALPIDRLGALRQIMRLLSLHTVDVRVIPDFYQYATLCSGVEEFGGMPIINLQSTPLAGWNLVLKRIFDIVASLFALLVFAPLMGVIAAVIKFGCPSASALFRQERVGLGGEVFTMYKFRTMVPDAEAGGSAWTVAKDHRRTALGAFLRRLSLDELPQLFNVLRGDMSLVGPRPEQPHFIEEFKTEIPRYALRHKMKAGMTGWAQINGLRGNTSISRRIEFDLYYIENWSLILDIRILLRTVFGGFMSPNAY